MIVCDVKPAMQIYTSGSCSIFDIPVSITKRENAIILLFVPNLAL